MKKLLSLVLILAIALSLTGCSLLGGSKGEVHISAGGERYATVVNNVKENGNLTPEDLKEQVTQVIPYGSGITINLKGDRVGDVLYSLYDGEGKKYYSGKIALEVPVAVGTYYCVVEVTWGDEVISETLEHAFCFARSE